MSASSAGECECKVSVCAGECESMWSAGECEVR